MEIKSVDEIISFPKMGHGPGSIGYIEKMIIGELLAILRPQLVIETGAYHGYTTRFLAEFLQVNGLPKCRIVSFDLPDVVDELLRNDEFLRDHELVTFVKGTLPESLAAFARDCRDELDFAIVDAAHEYGGVQSELQIIDAMLRPGGYVFCHDYRPDDAKYAGVLCAVNDFTRSAGYELLALNPSTWNGEEVVWGAAILRKPSHHTSAARELYYRTGLSSIYGRLRNALRPIARTLRQRPS